MDKLELIKNENQYEKAIKRLFRLMHKRLMRNANERKEMEVLTHLVEDYERKYYPLISAL